MLRICSIQILMVQSCCVEILSIYFRIFKVCVPNIGFLSTRTIFGFVPCSQMFVRVRKIHAAKANQQKSIIRNTFDFN